MNFKFVTNLSNEDWRGDARLYKLDTLIEYSTLYRKLKTNHIIVSAVTEADGSDPETYIFPADSNGQFLSMLQLPGSFKGELNHEKALEGFKNHYESN